MTLIIILILFHTFRFVPYEDHSKIVTRRCKIKMNLEPTKKNQGKALMIIKSSPNGLVFYLSLENVEPGYYSLQHFKKDINEPTIKSYDSTLNSNNILSVSVPKGMSKGRTLIEDKTKSCVDLRNYKSEVFMVAKNNDDREVIFKSEATK